MSGQDLIHPEDRRIGARIRRMRLRLRMSETELALRLGVSRRLIRRYEHATDQVSAHRLHTIARALQGSVVDLYADAPS